MVISVFVARYLGPEQFGILSFSKNLVLMFTSLTALGLSQIIVRELSINRYSNNDLLGTALGIKIIGSFLINLAFFFTAKYLIADIEGQWLLIIIAASELFKAFDVINYHYQSKILSKYPVRIDIASTVIIAFFKLLIIYLEMSLIWFGVALLLQSILSNFGLIILYNHQNKRNKISTWRFKKSLAKLLIKESWPMIFSVIGLQLQSRIDQVMLGAMSFTSDLGQYSVATQVLNIALFIPSAIMGSFMPAIARAKDTNEEKYQFLLLNSYRLMFTMFLIIAVPIFLLGSLVVDILYGDQYIMAGSLLSFLSFKLLFNFLGTAKASFIVNEGLFKFKMFTALLGAIINIGANYLLIPLYGAFGALIATYISLIISNFIIDLAVVKPRLNFFLMMKGMITFYKVVETIQYFRNNKQDQ